MAAAIPTIRVMRGREIVARKLRWKLSRWAGRGHAPPASEHDRALPQFPIIVVSAPDTGSGALCPELAWSTAVRGVLRWFEDAPQHSTRPLA
jgi:hypothetical protein